jgi:hypothetical protein
LNVAVNELCEFLSTIVIVSIRNFKKKIEIKRQITIARKGKNSNSCIQIVQYRVFVIHVLYTR